MSLVTANGNLCPLYGNQLAVKVAAGGQMPRSKFLRIRVPMLFCLPPTQKPTVSSVQTRTALGSPISTAFQLPQRWQ
jgi:hypothetical protein